MKRRSQAEYKRRWRKLNPGYNNAKEKARQKAWCLANPKRMRVHRRKWRQNNVEVCRELERSWRMRFPGKEQAKRGRRIAAELNACPPWSDLKAMEVVYQNAKDKTKLTGVQHHVDHIWPLQGVGFRGLHVPWNLRVVTRAVNIRKGNRRPYLREVPLMFRVR